MLAIKWTENICGLGVLWKEHKSHIMIELQIVKLHLHRSLIITTSWAESHFYKWCDVVKLERESESVKEWKHIFHGNTTWIRNYKEYSSIAHRNKSNNQSTRSGLWYVFLLLWNVNKLQTAVNQPSFFLCVLCVFNVPMRESIDRQEEIKQIKIPMKES